MLNAVLAALRSLNIREVFCFFCLERENLFYFLFLFFRLKDFGFVSRRSVKKKKKSTTKDTLNADRFFFSFFFSFDATEIHHCCRITVNHLTTASFFGRSLWSQTGFWKLLFS